MKTSELIKTMTGAPTEKLDAGDFICMHDELMFWLMDQIDKKYDIKTLDDDIIYFRPNNEQYFIIISRKFKEKYIKNGKFCYEIDLNMKNML